MFLGFNYGCFEIRIKDGKYMVMSLLYYNEMGFRDCKVFYFYNM